MIPTLLEIGPVPIHSYGLMIAIGFLLAIIFIQRDAKHAGLDPKIFMDGALYVLPIGIFGARITHILLYPDSYSLTDPIGWIAVWNGGLVFQGGPPLVIIFCYYYLKKNGVYPWMAADLTFPYLGLAHGFGRMGCFLNGCCYGATSDVPWAIPFRRIPSDTALAIIGSPAFEDHLQRFSDMTTQSQWSHPVHPTQLYSFVGLISICLFLLLLRKYWHPYPGFTMPLYFIAYGIFRFIVEFFRGDHNPVHVFSLSDQQIFALLFSLFGVFFFFFLRKITARHAASG